MTTVNLGNITDDKMHDIDCECYSVLDRIYMINGCNASYQIHRNDDGDVEVHCYDGFEQYWQASNEIGY